MTASYDLPQRRARFACDGVRRHRHREPRPPQLGLHPVGADREDGAHLRGMPAQVLDRRGGGGDDLIGRGPDAHLREPFDVGLTGRRRVVRREANRRSTTVEEVDELRRAGNRHRPPIDDSVEVEDHQSHPLGQPVHGAR